MTTKNEPSHIQPEVLSRQIQVFETRLENLFEGGGGAEHPDDPHLRQAFEDLKTMLVHLQTADEELRQQNEELAAMREALEAERWRYRDLFEFAPDGYLVTDAAGRILEANRAAATLFDLSAQYLREKPLTAYVQREDRKLFRTRLKELSRQEPGRHETNTEFELRLKTRRGSFFYAALTVAAERHMLDGRELLTLRWLIHDITARKQAEAELDELQRKLLAHRERERMQLAQLLHDGPVQDLYGLAYQLHALAPPASEHQPDSLANEAQEMQETLQQVIHRLRTICRDLRPPSLATFGLEKAIRSHAETFREIHPEIAIHFDLVPDGQTLSEDQRLGLFRIYQQALSNVARHAQASKVWIHFSLPPGYARLEVQDNGRGFSVPERWMDLARKDRMGLADAAERAEALDGRLQVISFPGRGAIVRVSVPLEPVAG